jgi:hypothetical protein
MNLYHVISYLTNWLVTVGNESLSCNSTSPLASSEHGSCYHTFDAPACILVLDYIIVVTA